MIEQKEFVWEKIHSKENWARYPNEEFVRFIGRYFFRVPKEKRKEIRFLELGVGQGAQAWFLIREGYDFYGIDLAKTAIEKLKIRFQEENIFVGDFNYRFKIADIRNIPFEDKFFNIIFDVATLWLVSFTEHNKVYQEVFRTLKKGGLFFTWHVLKDSWGDDNKNYIDKDTMENVDVGPLANQGITYFAKLNDLSDLIENNGLKIIHKEILTITYENMQKFLKFAIIYAQKS